MIRLLLIIFLISCSSSSHKGFVINNFKLKDKRIGKTTVFQNKEDSHKSEINNIKYSLTEKIDEIQKCIGSVGMDRTIHLDFKINKLGNSEEVRVSGIIKEKKANCISNIISKMKFQKPLLLMPLRVHQLLYFKSKIN